MKRLKFLIFAGMFISLATISNIVAASQNIETGENINLFLESPNNYVENISNDEFRFFGLARFYDREQFFLLSSDELKELNSNSQIELNDEIQLIIKKRHKLILLIAPGTSINFLKNKIASIKNLDLKESSISVLNYSEIGDINELFSKLRYKNLIFPLNYLSRSIENLILIINSLIRNFGLSIIFFALLVKLALYPLNNALFHSQQRVLAFSKEITPRLKDIKNTYKGEEQHFQILAMYKELGISPNYRIYPALIALIQIPILISIFNTLGEMPQLSNQQFVWIEDLSKPDMLTLLPFSIMGLGNTLNLLPFVMSIFIYLSGVFTMESSSETDKLNNRIFKNLLITSIFFVIFYSFPASMVLYWTASNFFSIFQQKIFFKK